LPLDLSRDLGALLPGNASALLLVNGSAVLSGNRSTVLSGHSLGCLYRLLGALLFISCMALLLRDRFATTSLLLSFESLDKVLDGSNGSLPSVSTVSSAAHGLMRGRALLSGYFVALLMVGGLVGGLVGGAALLLIASATLLGWYVAALLLIHRCALLLVFCVRYSSALLFIDSRALLLINGCTLVVTDCTAGFFLYCCTLVLIAS